MHVRTLVVAGFFLVVSQSLAVAGTIWVVPDTNVFSNTHPSNGFLNTVLTGNSSVGHVSGNTGSIGPAVSRTASNNIGDFSSVSLSNIDLLLLGSSVFFPGTPLGLSGSDITNIGNFISGGGDIMLQVETTSASAFDSYNLFLSGIGSTIQFTGERNAGGSSTGSSIVDPIVGIELGAFNILTGGTSLVQDISDRSALAMEEISAAVSAPTGLPLMGTGLAAISFIGWRQRRKAAVKTSI